MARYLVTGANGGMGRALCLALMQAGDEVWGLDKALPEQPARWRCLQADITDPASLGAVFSQVSSEAGGLDGIIHMAGIYELDSLVEIGEEEFVKAFNVNLFGMYRVNKVFMPLLNEKGRIVIVSSELAPLDPLPFTGIYGITKAAVEKYAYSLRMELQLLGRKVIVIRPGAVKTDMLPRSVECMERFCAETKLYPVNAGRFKGIVERVEARNITPEKLAKKALYALKTKRPKLVYKINRNPLLLLLNALPDRLQLWIIGKLLEG